MDQSRRAVESYWRSRMVDGATSDEDKITPVYKLEEICELLRSSHVSIVKEVSEFIVKRLQHKSPVVKQKALRIIKYAVGKSGAEFRREMQRNSVAVRELIHYKGQPDPLKGDSLNKAVRETAQEALSALFANEDSKASKAPKTENLGSRIQGFGNTNFDFVAEDKKSSFLSEVVNIGSATIKQGLNTLTQSPSLKKNDTGTYRGPNLRRSLTTETDYTEQYEGVSGSYGDTHSSSSFSKNASSGPSGNWGAPVQQETNEDSKSIYGERTREERLLETVVTSGGVRLQPSRDALRIFLHEASKLDALVMCHALDLKLESPLWQVRMKAMCVLEALLRKKEDEHFAIVAVYFSENKDLIEKCYESPQASLREKATKVLSLLNGEQIIGGASQQEQKMKAEAINVQMPDLIDAGDSDNLFETDDHTAKLNNQSSGDPSTSSSTLIVDLLGGGLSSGSTMNDLSNDDPFADVSFLNDNKEEQDGDLFSGMMVDKHGAVEPQVAGSKSGPELFDIFGSSSELSSGQNTCKGDVNDMMAGLSVSESKIPAKQNGTNVKQCSESLFSGSSMNPVHQVPISSLNSAFAPQISGSSTNQLFPSVDVQYNGQPGFIFNPSLVSQPINYNAMASMLAQQQFLATMSNFQHLGSLQSNVAAIHSAVSEGEYASPLPDIFNPSLSSQPPTSLMTSSKKEETKAFDFISDHIAAARDPKRVI